MQRNVIRRSIKCISDKIPFELETLNTLNALTASSYSVRSFTVPLTTVWNNLRDYLRTFERHFKAKRLKYLLQRCLHE